MTVINFNQILMFKQFCMVWARASDRFLNENHRFFLFSGLNIPPDFLKNE